MLQVRVEELRTYELMEVCFAESFQVCVLPCLPKSGLLLYTQKGGLIKRYEIVLGGTVYSLMGGPSDDLD